MRVALLSTLEPAEDVATPRGLLRVGGRAIVQHQLGAAIAWGCERVLCLADGHLGELLALEQLALGRGLSFQLVGNGHDVARHVGPQDEVLVFADGLLVAPWDLAGLAEKGPGVLAQPVEQGLAAGFERIDVEHATAGVLRIPGVLLSRLVDLPSDWNPLSALLRIAVQAELPQRQLPEDLLSQGRWTLVRSEPEAQALEPRWLQLYTAGAAAHGPGAWLAALIVQRLGPALMHAGTRPRVVTLAAALLALAGSALALVSFFGLAFILLGLAWLTLESAQLLARIDLATVPRAQAAPWAGPAFGWLLDGLFVGACVLRLAEGGEFPLRWVPAGFVALTLFGLLRLVPRIFAERRWAPWFGDRFVLALLLASASATQVFAPAVMAASLFVVVLALVAAPPGHGAMRAGSR